MRRPVWYRALLAIWGLWFTAALSDAAGLHTCPMHGGHAVAATAPAAHAHSHESAPPTRDANVCTCLGTCCCAPSVAAPRADLAVVESLTIVATHVGYRDVNAPVVRHDHALPFANGPPSAALI